LTSIPAFFEARSKYRPTLSWPEIALWLGVASVAGPTFYKISQQSWASEQGGHGPIVLALGLWLLVRRWPQMRDAATPSSARLAAFLGAVAALAYVFGRVSDQILIESYALYGLGLVGLYALLGKASLVRGWFPLAYLIFALPMPYTLTWMLTSHLRLWITQAAVATFQLFGVAIVRDGLTILVDQYELAVAEACSGMNSLISLSAIGLVYIYIRRSPRWWYFALMALPIIGFAVIGNFVRVLVLVAMTHFFGDAVAQSFLHETAGVITFVVALLGVIGVDAMLAPFVLRAPAEVTG
jgi:exosortase